MHEMYSRHIGKGNNTIAASQVITRTLRLLIFIDLCQLVARDTING